MPEYIENKPDLSEQELIEWGIKRPSRENRQRIAVEEWEREDKNEYII